MLASSIFDQEQKLARIIRQVEDVTEFVRLRSRVTAAHRGASPPHRSYGSRDLSACQEIQDVNCRPRAANEALQQEIIARQEAEEARRRTYTELEQLV